MMEESIQILLIEDDPAHAELIRRAFEHRGDAARLSIAGSLKEARERIRATKPNLIIADWRLPDGDSHELLADGHDSANLPVVIMTSYGSEKNAVEIIKAGALDYIVKSSESMADMPHIAERALEQWNAILNQERMQRALAESEAQFRLLAENSSDMISRHDPDLSVRYISPACRNLLGYEPAELLGHPVLPLIHPEDAKTLSTLLTETPRYIFTKPFPYRALHKNGEYVWLETTAKIIHDDDGNITEYQAASRDISERMRAESARQRALEDLQEAYDRTIEGWVIALDLRDRETEGHTKRVTEMAVRLAKALKCTDEDIIHIRRGALLHDMGKVGIPDEILHKPGPLTEAEWDVMRRHPQYAYQMLSHISYLNQALIIPYYHHERWDGSGYPFGLKGDEIPLFARLFAVVDVWDALSSDRPYRKRLPPRDVIKYIEENAGKLFDPDIANAFLPMIKTK